MTDHRFVQTIRSADLVAKRGQVTRISRTYLEADGPAVSLGALCEVECEPASRALPKTSVAEVVAIDQARIVLAPLEDVSSVRLGARVTARTGADRAPVGDALLGRAVDAMARPIDGGPPIRAERFAPLTCPRLAPLSRETPRRVVETGIRAIDGLLTLGQGQRVGVFAASGVGKTSLMAQLSRQVDADCCVACLIGERGREVEAFWSNNLPDEVKAKTTLVAATSDENAGVRVRAAEYALSLAEDFRDQGRHVLLLMDSITRLAMALREIGLAAGEPPTVRAYTPSVFAALPRLVERCGALKGGGAITAVMTILAETDDVDDPISELLKSLLDGHIVLSRTLAEQDHYPAIDVSRSISRLATTLRHDQHENNARTAIGMLGVYEGARTLIEAGVYARGADQAIDRALDHRPELLRFLQQGEDERTPFVASRHALARAVGAQS